MAEQIVRSVPDVLAWLQRTVEHSMQDGFLYVVAGTEPLSAQSTDLVLTMNGGARFALTVRPLTVESMQPSPLSDRSTPTVFLLFSATTQRLITPRVFATAEAAQHVIDHMVNDVSWLVDEATVRRELVVRGIEVER
jgi:hypothetical protein